MNIYLDMDNTLVNTTKGVANWVEKLGYSFDWSKYISEPSYELDHFFIGSNLTASDRLDILHDIFSMARFWDSLEPYDGIYDSVKELASNHTVFIATRPFDMTNRLMMPKANWIDRYLPFLAKQEGVGSTPMIFTRDKSKLPYGIAFDDYTYYLDAYHKAGFGVIRFNQPYNRDWEPVGGIKPDNISSWLNPFEASQKVDTIIRAYNLQEVVK